MYPVPPAKETQGRTDLYIGSWLKTGRVKREDIVLATKVCRACRVHVYSVCVYIV
jgi:aryl-alcohol dehydrogenase-like predicted oxidoreductase